MECEGMVILAPLICSFLRHNMGAGAKQKCIALLLETARHCDDATRLQRFVPYLISMISEPLAAVRAAVVRALTRILDMVEVFPISDVHVFSEYIFPSLGLLPGDSEEVVRVEFAACLPTLAVAMPPVTVVGRI